MFKKDLRKHESFGMISLARVSGSNRPLFGSSIRHSNFIQLEIYNGSLKRDLSRDWIHQEKLLLSLHMSYTQFAEAITAMNTTGTPCTITFANGHRVKGTDFKNKRVQFDEEFAKRIKLIASENNQYYKKIGEILGKKSIGKNDKKEILKQLDLLKMQIESNIPFIKTQFSEQMDKTVTEFKGEAEAFLTNRINTLGLEGFKKEVLALAEKTIEEDEEK